MCWLVRTRKDLGGRPPLASRCISLSWLFFHGVNTGSNPVGDAKSFNKLQAVPLSRGTVIRGRLRRWRENSGPVGTQMKVNSKGNNTGQSDTWAMLPPLLDENMESRTGVEIIRRH
jgi:hypothetical protein